MPTKMFGGDHTSRQGFLENNKCKWWLSKGNPRISGTSGLVKYDNLARFIVWWLVIHSAFLVAFEVESFFHISRWLSQISCSWID